MVRLFSCHEEFVVEKREMVDTAHSSNWDLTLVVASHHNTFLAVKCTEFPESYEIVKFQDICYKICLPDQSHHCEVLMLMQISTLSSSSIVLVGSRVCSDVSSVVVVSISRFVWYLKQPPQCRL